MNRTEVIQHAMECRLVGGSIDTIKLAYRLGIEVYGDEEAEDFNAEITHLPGPNRFEIVVNTKHSLTRQRFSIAHEIAHFVLHRDRIEKYGSLRRGRDATDPGFDAEIEKEADELAEELLMPEILLKEKFPEAFSQVWLTLELIQRIAHQLKVSVVVAAVRLRNLGRKVPYISFSYGS